MTTEFSKIKLELAAPAARIRLNNGPLNVIDVPMMEELAAALASLDARPDISAIVLSGSPKAFSVGVDVKAHTPDKVAQMLEKFHAVIRALLKTRKVMIAAVEGACLGGGAELAFVCDLVYTAREASWAFPEIKLACYPPVASAGLAALVGQKRAADLVLTGRQISGDEALAIGLATGAAPAGELESLVQDAVARLAQLSPAALAMAKKAFYAWDAIHFDKGLDRAEKVYLEELIKTEDCAEGIRAFMEKRPPVWKGR